MKKKVLPKLSVRGKDRNGPVEVARIVGPEFSLREACKFNLHFPVFIAFGEKTVATGTKQPFAGCGTAELARVSASLCTIITKLY
jgi:hypothetical protein